MIIGSFLGSYIAMIIWLGGMKYTQVSTASALNQTTNIFIFIFAAIFLKEKITKQKTFGILSAMIGATMVTFG
jgi:drug/metabolite transporter (DMT)-like permease